MALKTPTVSGARLYFYDEYTEQRVFVCDIVDDWQNWQDWLNDDSHKSFRFEHGVSCTVIKEYRKHFGGELRPVWYAHRRLGGKLRRKYIGKSENCTYEKLRAVAFDLSQRTLET